MVNRAILAMAAAGALAILPNPALAEEVQMQPQSEEAVKTACDANGGTSWASGGMYGCAKTCGDKTCGVICDKDTGCLGYTPGRTGTTRDPNALNAAINGTLRADGHGDEDRDSSNWGLLGLLGILGLAGFAARNRSRERTDRI